MGEPELVTGGALPAGAGAGAGPGPPHPYWPRELRLPAGYRPNERPVSELLGLLLAACVTLLAGAWLACGLWAGGGAGPGGRGSPRRGRGRGRRAVLCWFALCAALHLVLEGWFSVSHVGLHRDQSLLSQIWKEYAKGDSRYIIADNFTVCMETVTALAWGPLSAWTVIAFLQNKPYRFVLQLIVSLGQLYGDVLYFYTAYRDGFIHSEFGHPLHFWFYFVFLNGLWIVIPSILIRDAWVNLSRAQREADQTSDAPGGKAKAT
uniref:3-beta-hydroxysteroid-Delta(8), Delta(7)-isomerase n=1 Tax=Pristiophorus japonicus TaxID=55135 RepID=UPI00398E3961